MTTDPDDFSTTADIITEGNPELRLEDNYLGDYSLNKDSERKYLQILPVGPVIRKRDTCKVVYAREDPVDTARFVKGLLEKSEDYNLNPSIATDYEEKGTITLETLGGVLSRETDTSWVWAETKVPELSAAANRTMIEYGIPGTYDQVPDRFREEDFEEGNGFHVSIP